MADNSHFRPGDRVRCMGPIRHPEYIGSLGIVTKSPTFGIGVRWDCFRNYVGSDDQHSLNDWDMVLVHTEPLTPLETDILEYLNAP